MMGRQAVDQSQLFYLFNLEKRIRAASSALYQSDRGTILGEFREKLEPFYSEIGRPSIDPVEARKRTAPGPLRLVGRQHPRPRPPIHLKGHVPGG